jgi:hypothetical protein
MLEWAMRDDALKTQLFRFVDVFPRCRDDADVLRHLHEYPTTCASSSIPRGLREHRARGLRAARGE